MNGKNTGKWLKRNIGQIVMILSNLLMGLGCGIIAAQAAGSGGLIWMMLLALGGIYGWLLLHIVLHEAGHMVFGLATGYRFVSFRVFSFVLQRTEEGRLKFGHSPLPGAAGQCLMGPPEMKEGRTPFVLYNLGGALMNLMVSALCLIGRAIVVNPAADALLLMGALTGLVTALTNGVPLRMGAVDNDGYNILSMKKSDQAVRAFRIQMLIAEAGARGVRLRDMPQEWFFMPSRTEMKNSLCAAAGVFACGRLMDQMNLAEAERAMQGMLRIRSGMVGLHRVSMQMDMVSCRLLMGREKAEAVKALDAGGKKLMKAMKNHLSAIRTEYLLALLGEKDEKKAEEILQRFERAAEKWPSKADVESERELIACAQEKAKETGGDA